MKIISWIAVIAMVIVFSGCNHSRSSSNSFISVNVNAQYPEKELYVHDLFDVEYIPLQTRPDFITSGLLQTVGDHYLVTTNRANDGNIYLFDRQGKIVRKINRKGRGAQEYSRINGVELDENREELFVNDWAMRKILVYDLTGNYKRSFAFADSSYYEPNDVYNYDKHNLVAYKTYSGLEKHINSCHVLISKIDGHVSRELKVPVGKPVDAVIRDGEITAEVFTSHTVFYKDSLILTNFSTDTIYCYSPDGQLTPKIVRTPSVHDMNPQKLIYPVVFTSRYCFVTEITKKLKQMKVPHVNLVYDNQEKQWFSYSLYNKDFPRSTKGRKHFDFPLGFGTTEIASYSALDAFDLIQVNQMDRLKGGLKTIADSLTEESNPVIMLLNYK